MIQVTAVNRTGGRVPSDRVRRIVSRAAEILAAKTRRGPAAITIVFVTPAESRRLKLRFLRRDRAANVLSFRYNGEGELLLSPAVIRAEARRAGVPYVRRLDELAIHGLLHLHGYHHEGSSARARTFDIRERSLRRALGLR